MNIVFHPRVFAEVDAIMRYYEHVTGGDLADEFYEEFRLCVLSAAENPELVSQRMGGFRRMNLKRFPYNFLFIEKADQIRVLVVRHHARHPTYGTRRK